MSKSSALGPLLAFALIESAGLMLGMLGLGLRNGPLAGLGLIAMFASLVFACAWGIKTIRS